MTDMGADRAAVPVAGSTLQVGSDKCLTAMKAIDIERLASHGLPRCPACDRYRWHAH